ncbi:MAG: hypothetical protein M1818_001155 [Claussenomyces sp. TS43310]|nr:MAG: hypothetical protein M1818_001155 [Claussenomyces sp. TS43310]
MDKAKAAVSSFLTKDGKHETTVSETINPAVQNEHVTRTQLEEQQRVVDREVHQHHHHTSVQPITDREILPETHSHNLIGTEHRHIKHGNDDHIRSKLDAEAAQFKNTREVGEAQVSQTAAPTIAGEHVHHHVHETIQPIIQKETIQPSVVHTTIPVHEVHTNEAKHHTASALPAVTMAEFSKQGGSLGGRDERTDHFAGEPRSVGNTLGGSGARGTTSLTESEGLGRGTAEGTAGPHNSRLGNAADPRVDSDLDGSRNGGAHTTRSGTSGTTHSATGSSYSNTGTTDTTGTTGTTSRTKPSLMDKLNPKIDSDGDGKAGFMK